MTILRIVIALRFCRGIHSLPGGPLESGLSLKLTPADIKIHPPGWPGLWPFSRPDSPHIRPMAKNPDTPRKPGKTPKSKAHRPDVQPIGPALAELLNPAINRGDAGMGSGTGLQPPPDNSWDRRAGGEAAAHRARASTRGTSEDVAKRDASRALRKRRRPTTAPRRRSPRSIRTGAAAWAADRGGRRRGRWRGRRATRWKRSASRPPPTRWKI